MYDLPKFNIGKFWRKAPKFLNGKPFIIIVLLIIIVVSVVFSLGKLSLDYANNRINSLFGQVTEKFQQPDKEKHIETYISKIDYEEAVINTVKSASPSVVSIIISKNQPVYEEQYISPFPDFDIQIPQYIKKGTELKEVGAGSGFIVSEDGLVITNKHVVLDKEAEYTVSTNNGKKYPAKVLALDPVQDLAIIKINQTDTRDTFAAVKLGDSDTIQIGQGAIAIGNSLGEFRNTVSVGVISGLGRTVFASGDSGFSEILEDVIQTDAAINPGNSGGPLLNLKGEVVGVNVAMAQGAQSIGFAIPINIAKRDLGQVVQTNKISYPFLGVRYILVKQSVKEKYGLPVDYGAYILGSEDEPAITKDSAAAKAGLKEKDIILEFDGQRIAEDMSMSKIISRYNPGDVVTIKVLRDGKEISIVAILGERS